MIRINKYTRGRSQRGGRGAPSGTWLATSKLDKRMEILDFVFWFCWRLFSDSTVYKCPEVKISISISFIWD